MQPQSSTHPGKRILCVDDDPIVLAVTREVLKMKGYEVETADCGTRAVDQICRQFDLVIVDYNLPDFNGDVVAERFKEQQPHTPVLMLSGSPNLPLHALDNVNAFLMKGTGAASLVGAVSALTDSVH